MCISISACRDVVRCLFFPYECRNRAEVCGHGRKGVNCVPAICGKFGFSSHHGKETTMKKCNHLTSVAKNLNVCIEIFLVHPQRSKTPVWEILFGGAKDRAGPLWPTMAQGSIYPCRHRAPEAWALRPRGHLPLAQPWHFSVPLQSYKASLCPALPVHTSGQGAATPWRSPASAITIPQSLWTFIFLILMDLGWYFKLLIEAHVFLICI